MRKNNVDTYPLIAVCIVILLAVILYGPQILKFRAQKAEEPAEQSIISQIVGENVQSNTPDGFDFSSVPEYSGEPSVVVNDGKPFFTEDEITNQSFESYGDLDSLGRCTVAFGCYGMETVPEEGEERESLESVTPTGYIQSRYKYVDDGDPDVDEEGWVYNRCHLIAWCISGENANQNNLITGTRYLNTDGMWPYEEQVQDYIYDHPGNHVMYRVTPVFEGRNKLASGVLMEAYSVEDNGALQFAAYCYNVQPYIYFDYSNGANGYSGICLDPDASSVVNF